MNQLDRSLGIPAFRKPVGEVPPSPKESLTSLADSLPRFGDMDPKSDMLASSGEDAIAFDSPENLTN
jgi:hypothetical protein